MSHSSETVVLAADGASATIALCGAEPLSWRVAGRELIWHGDPAHWPQRAPILFPVVGASAGGAVRVEGRSYPMPRHGFARDLPFGLVERRPDRARLRLRATSGTLRHYPFRFELEVEAGLTADRLSLRFTVTNADDRPMPYGLGFHPGFPWPFDGGSGERYRLLFERPEAPGIPDITDEGLLRTGLRRAPFAGRVLPLDPEM
ncbi:MAG: aldose 1-epimerase family protein, partial [Microvirga sp.]